MDVLERTQQLAIAMSAAPGTSLSFDDGGTASAAGDSGGGGGGGLNKAALMDTLRTLQEQMQVMQSQAGAMAAMQVGRGCSRLCCPDSMCHAGCNVLVENPLHMDGFVPPCHPLPPAGVTSAGYGSHQLRAQEECCRCCTDQHGAGTSGPDNARSAASGRHGQQSLGKQLTHFCVYPLWRWLGKGLTSHSNCMPAVPCR